MGILQIRMGVGQRFARLRAWLVAILLGAAVPAAHAQAAPPPYVYGPLLPLLLQAPENGWIRVNANLFSDVWVTPELSPLDGPATHPPARIIIAWSGFAWDSNRGDVILYGGGHANYSGNDVYRWHGSNMQWERASLPSEIRLDPVSGWQAIDGVDNAPSSAHTYDNNVFLPIVDRFMSWGGAAYNNGGPYLRVSETDPSQSRRVGPYLFDPNRADGNKVGGSTGSHVQRVAPHPEVVGGHMWQNRDLPKNLPGQTMPGAHVDGCTGSAIENGHDVIYTGATNAGASQLDLYRYQVTNVADPTQDQVAKVGVFWVGTSGTTTCGYDPARKLFVRTGNNSIPFLFWDVTVPGLANRDQVVAVDASIASFQAWLAAQSFDLQNCALDFDPVRHSFPLWCGGPVTWDLHDPPAGNTTTGWTIAQRPAPSTADPGTAMHALGILGKWRYAPYYDAFVTLEDPYDGNVWFYKPVGWQQPNPPGNVLPTVALTSPSSAAVYAPRQRVDLSSTAGDADGTIVRVEYYVNGAKAGESSTPPYTVSINPVPVGAYTVVAIAVDNVGGMSKSLPVTFSVAATLTTTVLQRGLNGYAGAADTWLDYYGPAIVHGGDNPLYLDGQSYFPLTRFAIFQSDGGPVPDGAVLQSATLSLYKQYYSETLQLNALRKPWVEGQATWTSAQAGSPWAAVGASAAGTDYDPAVDASVTPSFNPGWIAFDVTARVQQWSDAGQNFGWRIAQVGIGNTKQFTSSEYSADPTLRPKLAVVYSVGGAQNPPPTVSLTSPANGAHIVVGGSFALAALASDSDGIKSVQYLANGVSLGAANTAPYALNWTPGAAGSYTITAVATDNLLATTTSAPVVVVVDAAGSTTTVILQRGLNGYGGATDTFLDRYVPTTVRGSFDPLYLDASNYTPLVRFSIFQSEGGPVPNAASVQSATLSLYKQYYADTLRLNALLAPWVEAEATWTVRQAGTPWIVPGAAGSGADFSGSADALVSVGFNPGWITFDVTPRVAQWAAGSNFGWRMAQTGTLYGSKLLVSSEQGADLTLRPKLTVVYATGANVPPTVALTSPASGASIALGGSFLVSATAADSDGILSVEFFANGASLGKVLAAPFTLAWTPGASGTYAITAVATDTRLASTTTAAASVTVTGATVVLQRGLNGYAGATDTFLDRYVPTTARGSYDPLYLDQSNYTPLIRFAIYTTDGGPVPPGATIDSASLSLYKQYYSETLQLNAMLKPWTEAQATWSNSQRAVAWAVAGARGVGTDYDGNVDALLGVGFNPGWVTFDVKARVAGWAAGANFGWRVAQTGTSYGSKLFDASEQAADPTLRPKLTIVYH